MLIHTRNGYVRVHFSAIPFLIQQIAMVLEGLLKQTSIYEAIVCPTGSPKHVRILSNITSQIRLLDRYTTTSVQAILNFQGKPMIFVDLFVTFSPFTSQWYIVRQISV